MMAWDGGEPVGAATYQITGSAGVLVADDMLTASPLGRALLLQFFARHVDQVSEVEVQVGAGELPELWATDLAAVTQATTSFPDSPAPMARVLALGSLAGMPAGEEHITVEVVADPLHRGPVPPTRTGPDRSRSLSRPVLNGGDADRGGTVCPGLWRSRSSRACNSRARPSAS